jgi:putative phosphoribosyl transferase
MTKPDSVRLETGRRLAAELRSRVDRTGVVVLALSTDAIPVAAEVAQRLEAPWDLFLARELVVAEPERVRIGAVASGGVLILDREAVEAHAIPPSKIVELAQSEARELARIEREQRIVQDPPDLRNSKAILVGDGRIDPPMLRMVVAALRRRWIARVILALPTVTASAYALLREDADAVVSAAPWQISMR